MVYEARDLPNRKTDQVVDSRLVKTTAVSGFRPLGVHGQQVVDSHRQLAAVVNNRLGPEQAAIFARPERRDGGSEIDWYSDLEGPVRPLSELPESERHAIEEDLAAKVAQVRELGQEMADSEGGARTIGEMLLRAVILPGPEQILTVGGRPVLVLWGFEPEGQVPGYVPDFPKPLPAPAAAVPPSAEVAALAAGSGGGWRGWLRWILLLLLLILLLLLLLRACEPLPPVIVENRLPDRDLGPELAEAEARGDALRAQIAELEQRRDDRLAYCIVPPEQDVTELPELPPELPPALPAEPPDPQPEPDVPELPDLPQIAEVPPVEAPPRQPAPQAPPSCIPERSPSEAPEVVLVVDASGSMDESIPGASSRMEASRRSIADLLDALPEDVDVGLVEFSDCGSINRDRFYSSSERGELKGRVNALRPDKKTPLARAVERAGTVTSSMVDGVIVVVTDGEDSCKGDPCAAARRVASSKPNVKINVIDISGDDDNPTAACMAKATGGRVFQPRSVSEMRDMVQAASEEPDVRQCQ